MRQVFLVLALMLAGCATVPAPEEHPPVAQDPASHALKMVGRPYRFGGASPQAGFDCSGLVQFSFAQAGKAVPRSTEEQRLLARPVAVSELRRGDLVFFDHEGRKNSHLGIYLGDGTFVHAPSTGKSVRSDKLDSPFWKQRLSELRRFH
jgi:cell wall-associated NlpC family hydrolase